MTPAPGGGAASGASRPTCFIGRRRDDGRSGCRSPTGVDCKQSQLPAAPPCVPVEGPHVGGPQAPAGSAAPEAAQVLEADIRRSPASIDGTQVRSGNEAKKPWGPAQTCRRAAHDWACKGLSVAPSCDACGSIPCRCESTFRYTNKLLSAVPLAATATAGCTAAASARDAG